MLKVLLPSAGIVGILIGFGVGELFDHVGPSKEQNLLLKSLHASTTVLPLGQPLSDFSLLDHHHQKFTLERLRKKWSLLFFGYTHCPEECLQTVSMLKTVYERLEDEYARLQFIFVSLDPEENEETLMNYIPRSFLGVTGETASMTNFTRQLGVAYHRIPHSKAHRNYLIDHSASILLVDPLAKLRAVFSPPHQPEVIIADFRKIQAYYAEECCLPLESPKTTLIRGKD